MMMSFECNDSIDAKPCQQSVAAPFTLFTQSGVYTGWAAGSIDGKPGERVCGWGNGWLRPLFCVHSRVNDHILCTLHRKWRLLPICNKLFKHADECTLSFYQVFSASQQEYDLFFVVVLTSSFVRDCRTSVMQSGLFVSSGHLQFHLSETATDTDQWLLMDCDGH